jgi:hypothetical protein
MAVACLLLALVCTTAVAQPKSPAKGPVKGQAKGNLKSPAQAYVPQPGVQPTYRSERFFLHTDLSPDEAQELLDRLETMLTLIAEYWGRPPRGIIECYVVKDLKNWPTGTLGDGEEGGRAMIEAGGGVTQTSTRSIVGGGVKQLIDAKAIVYAGADHGTPQHEAVHAYCGQTFGRTGPVWYSEGMAEMGQYWRKLDNRTVQIHPGVVKYLQSSELKSMNAIVNNKEQTGDSWQNYAWRWALCHLLANNPNYADRFRPLGLGLLTQDDTSFEKVYGDMADEFTFEYRFFLKHIDNGYRVDLCSFDWKKKFIPLHGSTPLTSRIRADRGWQPSQALLSPDEEYEYTASGNWSLGKDSSGLTAHGDSDGNGQLLGVILHDFELSEPFKLDTKGTLKPPVEGKLFLRANDKWNELADNKGQVTFKIKPVKN